MKFSPPLIPGTLQKRWKRFLAEVVLKDGSLVTVHCPNPGSMRGNAIPGSKVLLLDTGKDHLQKGRKLRYRWTIAQTNANPVCIDTSISNHVVQKALMEKKIPELSHYTNIEAEYSIGNSRLDFLLHTNHKSPCFLEVKSVSMVENGIAYFPDSVTKRGQKHLMELMELKHQGHRSVIFFLVQCSGLQTMRPADHIDPVYGKTLRAAANLGVEILAYDIKVQSQEIQWGKRITVEL